MEVTELEGYSWPTCNTLCHDALDLRRCNTQVGVVKVMRYIWEFYTPLNISAMAKGRDFKFRILVGRVKF